MHPDDWLIASFAADKAVGNIKSPSTGAEAAFSFEAWWPCEPGIAQTLQDSDQRRYLLLPQPGEQVAVEWKTSWRGDEVPGRVKRRRPLSTILPRITFSDWLRKMGEHIPAIEGLGADEWSNLFRRLDDDIEDTVRSKEPGNPERHLGVLAWLVGHAPADFAALRLSWLASSASPGDTALECWGDVPRVFVHLSPKTVEQLAANKLVIVDTTLQT